MKFPAHESRNVLESNGMECFLGAATLTARILTKRYATVWSDEQIAGPHTFTHGRMVARGQVAIRRRAILSRAFQGKS